MLGWVGRQRSPGDLEDRKRMRAADVRKERAAREQREADDRAMEARKLAGMGYSVAEITEELARVGIVRARQAVIALPAGWHARTSAWRWFLRSLLRC